MKEISKQPDGKPFRLSKRRKHSGIKSSPVMQTPSPSSSTIISPMGPLWGTPPSGLFADPWASFLAPKDQNSSPQREKPPASISHGMLDGVSYKRGSRYRFMSPSLRRKLRLRRVTLPSVSQAVGDGGAKCIEFLSLKTLPSYLGVRKGSDQ